MEKSRNIKQTKDNSGLEIDKCEKERLRERMLSRRSSLTSEQINTWSFEICSHISEHPLFIEANTVYFYYPIRNEVNLLPLAQRALNMGKVVGFPKTDKDSMEFYRAESLGGFQKGAFGVPEPEPDPDKLLSICEPLILTPGLVFDRGLQRIGYGKGYYDKYALRFPKSYRIGAAYGFQVIDKIPSEEYDIPMHEIVTEVYI